MKKNIIIKNKKEIRKENDNNIESFDIENTPDILGIKERIRKSDEKISIMKTMQHELLEEVNMLNKESVRTKPFA